MHHSGPSPPTTGQPRLASATSQPAGIGAGSPWSQLSGLLRGRASFSSGSAPPLCRPPSGCCLGSCSPPVAVLYVTPSLRVRLREQLSVPTVPRSPSPQNSLCFLPELLSLRRPPCSEPRGALPAPAQHLLLGCLLCGPTCCFRTQPRLPRGPRGGGAAFGIEKGLSSQRACWMGAITCRLWWIALGSAG